MATWNGSVGDTIYPTGTGVWVGSQHWVYDSTQDNSNGFTNVFFELATHVHLHDGFELRAVGGTTELHMNTNGNVWDPGWFTINGGSHIQSGAIQIGDTIALFRNGTTAGNQLGEFVVANSHMFSGGTSPWTVTTTSTPASGTQSHNYVQDSIRDITCTKTAAYTHKWEFKHRDVSSGNWHPSMGQNAVCYTCKHWPGGGNISTDIVSECFQQADGTYDIEIVSNTTFPNAQITTGDVSTLHADIDMQISDGVGGWTWITAGDVLASFTYEATNVVFTVGAGYVGDTVAIIVTDTNQYPDYDNGISFSYDLDNPPANHQGSASQLTATIFNTSSPHKLESSNNWTLSGTWIVGDDGSSSPTGLEGTLKCWRETPIPQQLQSVVMSRAFVENPIGQNPDRRRRAHSFW